MVKQSSIKNFIKENYLYKFKIELMTKGEKKEKKMMTEISRDYTVNLHKRLQKTTFKKKAPKALK